MKIKLMNKISPIGTDLFDRSKYEVGENVEDPDAMLVRSAALHDMEFGDGLLAIARAGAGVNNIPIDRCTENGIVVFNTPGANSNGVKELVLSALIFSSRNVIAANKWVEEQKDNCPDVAKAVEKGKGQFSGHEIQGKTLGVIGLGALGMNVIGFDKFITVDSAWSLSRSVIKASSNEEIFKKCDYITVHVPLTPETENMINKESIAMMKDGVRIMNFARAGLVNAADMKEALDSGKAKQAFEQMVAAQGGDAAYIRDPGRFPQAKVQYTLKAPQKGYIAAMDAEQIGRVCVLLGAGRRTKEDDIDPSAGILLLKKTGDLVEAGEPLATLLCGSETLLPEAERAFLAALRFSDTPPEKIPLILETVE